MYYIFNLFDWINNFLLTFIDKKKLKLIKYHPSEDGLTKLITKQF